MRNSSKRFGLAAINLALVAFAAIFYFGIVPTIPNSEWLSGLWLVMMAFCGALALWCLITGVRLRLRRA